MSSLKDKVIYFYIRNIKRWMYCPACQNGILTVKSNNKTWKCDKCEYSIFVKEFESGVVFWFCDNCGTFLNIQQDFNPKSGHFICKKCGLVNDVSEQNIIS